jgi:hypothetical protein
MYSIAITYKKFVSNNYMKTKGTFVKIEAWKNKTMNV